MGREITGEWFRHGARVCAFAMRVCELAPARIAARATYGRNVSTLMRGTCSPTFLSSSAIPQGAAVVRVHDVFEMDDVMRVADAIWG